MMNMCKKMITFICIGMITFLFSACGDATNDAVKQTESVSSEEMVAKVISNLEKAESMKTLTMAQSDMTTADTTSTGSMEAEVTTIYNPLNMVISTMSNLEKIPMVTYVEENDGIVTTYMEYAGQWMKQSMESGIVLDSLQMYDTKENAVLFLKSATDWKEISVQENAVTLEGILTADVLKTLVENTKSLQVMGMAGLTEEYYEGVLDTKMTLVVDTKTNLPVSYTIDLANVLEVLMNNITSSFTSSDAENAPEKTNVNQYQLTVEFSDIDAVKKVEIPQEVKENAVNLEEQIENASIPTGENGEELAVE